MSDTNHSIDRYFEQDIRFCTHFDSQLSVGQRAQLKRSATVAMLLETVVAAA